MIAPSPNSPAAHSSASPLRRPLAMTPASLAAAAPARGGEQPVIDPTSAAATPVLVQATTTFDARKLQAAWDEEGAALVVCRYRIVPDRRIAPPPPLNLRLEALLLLPLCALIAAAGTLIVALARGGVL